MDPERLAPPGVPADLVRHLTGSTTLSRAEVERVVADVTSYFHETTEQFVRRRHRELRSSGRRNEEIFDQIQIELTVWPVTAGDLSLRQLRRIVYT